MFKFIPIKPFNKLFNFFSNCAPLIFNFKKSCPNLKSADRFSTSVCPRFFSVIRLCWWTKLAACTFVFFMTAKTSRTPAYNIWKCWKAAFRSCFSNKLIFLDSKVSSSFCQKFKDVKWYLKKRWITKKKFVFVFYIFCILFLCDTILVS